MLKRIKISVAIFLCYYFLAYWLILVVWFDSHVHVNATLQFLKCPPNLSGIENYVDEADMFYQQPSTWLEKNIDSPPTYLVFFDVLANQISNYLTSNGYQLVHNFFHTDLPEGRIGRYVLIFHQSNSFVMWLICLIICNAPLSAFYFIDSLYMNVIELHKYLPISKHHFNARNLNWARI